MIKAEVIVGIISETRDDKDIAYLLVRSNKNNFGKYSNCFYPPGGHIEPGESKEAALTREILEELSIQVKPIKEIAETDSDVKNQTTYWWSCDVISGNIIPQLTEIDDVGFFTQSEMKELELWPATKSFFESYIFNK